MSSAYALCPGEGSPCSGNGQCGTDDKCTCHRNWQGVDCSLRTCQFSRAWDEGKTDWVYKECGGKGICDRKEGLCKCFEGYEGRGCRRMSCPEGCNSRGVCKTLYAIDSTYNGWDASKIQRCVCDPAYEGISCLDRKCKRGDDPLSLFVEGTTNLQQSEVQTITASSCGDGDTFTIKYTDWRGETWETRVLDSYGATAIEVEEALESLPNHAIPSVTVARSGSAGSYAFAITFSDSANSGDQAAFVINEAQCYDPGCQPMMKGSHGEPTSTASCVSVAETRKGSTENAVCSNRGECDSEEGNCVCVTGYTGESCNIQTVVA